MRASVSCLPGLGSAYPRGLWFRASSEDCWPIRDSLIVLFMNRSWLSIQKSVAWDPKMTTLWALRMTASGIFTSRWVYSKRDASPVKGFSIWAADTHLQISLLPAKPIPPVLLLPIASIWYQAKNPFRHKAQGIYVAERCRLSTNSVVRCS